MLVETLPACSPAEEGWIVYLVPAAQLQACEAGSWTVVDLRGHDGATGVGKDGADGAPGKAGEPGAPGVAGPAGKDGKPTPKNVWPDPVDGSSWLIGGTGDPVSATACSNGWSLPTTTEVAVASSHGLYSGVPAELAVDPAYECAWTTDANIVGGEAKPGYHRCFTTGYQPHAKPWGIYCLKDG